MSEMNNEIWKPIKGYKGRYEVSNMGNIKRLARIVKRPTCKREPTQSVEEIVMCIRTTQHGYKTVKLVNAQGERKDILVHRLVAAAFIPKPVGKDYINHKDGNKINNCVDNLEWVSIKENNQHAYDTGLKRKQHAGQFVKGVKGPMQYILRSTN